MSFRGFFVHSKFRSIHSNGVAFTDGLRWIVGHSDIGPDGVHGDEHQIVADRRTVEPRQCCAPSPDQECKGGRTIPGMSWRPSEASPTWSAARRDDHRMATESVL